MRWRLPSRGRTVARPRLHEFHVLDDPPHYPRADRGEAERIVGDEIAIGGRGGAAAPQAQFGQFLGGRLRRLLCRVHYPHALAQNHPERTFQQWIMGAAEHEGVGPELADRPQIVLGHEFDDGVVRLPALFDERDEERTRPVHDRHVGVEALDGAEIGAAPYRGLGPDDGDAAVPGGRHCGPRPRLHDPYDRQREDTPQMGQGRRRRRVACDHDQFRVLAAQETDVLLGESDDGGGRLDAVGHASRVAEVDDVLVRQRARDSAHDGQAAEARIENRDWRGLVGQGGP